MSETTTPAPSGFNDQQTVLALVGGLIVVLLLATMVARGATLDRSEPGASFPIPLGEDGIHMPFSGGDNPSALPQGPPGRTWSILGGTWGTLSGTGYVVEPVKEDATTMALLPAPTDASILVTLVVVADNTGLVARFTDERNHLVVRVRTREAYVELLEVRDGHSVLLGRSAEGLALPDGGKLRLVVEGTSASVTFDGEPVVQASVPVVEGMVFAGLMASGSQATLARFDDLTIVATDLMS